MKYRVRSKDGELTFESRAALQDAARNGLVELDDEVQGEEDPTWRKVSQVNWLTVATANKPGLNNPFLRWMLLAVAGAIAAFWLIYKGRTEHSLELQAAGIGIVVVVALVLMRVTTNAQRRR